MANMPGVGLEIYNAGGGWRDQKWAPSWSVKLPSLRQGRVQTLPCSLGRQSARSSSLERGKPRLSALKRRRTFYNATTCHVSQTNECALTDDKAPLWRSLFA
ncbi:hypothetical protein T08_16227 [Trichinella sp. T8]|nr:hypothetical protein T08_16227 [Trichinella sp. T8]